MSGTWPRAIRDPIHGLIRFDDRSIDRLLWALIDCPEFQRLRRIKQLGFSETVFPGASHSRFAHSIGVMANARRFINRLRQLDARSVDQQQEEVLLCGALLHDVGHGPFSHAFEKVSGENHERRTVEAIVHPDTHIHKTLRGHHPNLPEMVASLFDEGVRQQPNAYTMPKFLVDIIHSQLDADRSDYLARDSHFTGTEYGHFDLTWLLDHLFHDEVRDRLYLNHKAHQAVEEYVFARYHMYQAVYFHKTTRAAEVMFRQLLSRFKRLVDNRTENARRFAPDGPPAVLRAFSTGLGLDDFLRLDDHSITEFIKSGSKSPDRGIKYLSSGLLCRRLYKCVDMTVLQKNDPARLVPFADKARDQCGRSSRELGLDGDEAFCSDSPSDTPYKIYDPDQEHPETQIHIADVSGKQGVLSERSELVGALKSRVTLLRYYFPVEARQAVVDVCR